MISRPRLPVLSLALLLGGLAPVISHAQTAVVDLSFDNPGARFANTGTAGTTFGLAQGNITFATGVDGGSAAIFDGFSSLQASGSPLTTGLTVSFWMNTTSTAGSGPQWYSGNGLIDGELGGDTTDWGLSQVDSRVAFGIGSPDRTIFSTSNVNTGNWIHVAATWDTSGTMNLYINGGLEATYGVGSSTPRNTVNPFFIGKDLGGNLYTGSLDQIQIYDSALGSGQIAALAAVPEPSTYAMFAGLACLSAAIGRRRAVPKPVRA